MKSRVGALLICLMLAGPALAQMVQLNQGAQPAQRAEPTVVPLKSKLMYICKQLDLNDKQWQHVEGLFAVFEADMELSAEDRRDLLVNIQNTWQAMKDAQEAGDEALANELRERLRNMAPGARAMKNFLDGLRPALTEEQAGKLPGLVEEVENAKDLSLKPIQVIRIARGLDLNLDQRSKIDQLAHDFREKMSQGGEMDEAARAKALEELIDQIAGALAPDQRAKFEERVDRLRLDFPRKQGSAPRPVPATQPAADKK